MRTGQAVVVHGQTFELREVAVPDPEPGTILLRQEMAGICGTDLHNWQKGFAEPTFLGHENVGIIEAIGSGVTHDYVGNALTEGDRVIFHPRRAGFAYGFQPEQPGLPPFSGGFGDYIYLTDPTACFIKTSASAQAAVLIEPFTIGVHAVLHAQCAVGRHGDRAGLGCDWAADGGGGALGWRRQGHCGGWPGAAVGIGAAHGCRCDGGYHRRARCGRTQGDRAGPHAARCGRRCSFRVCGIPPGGRQRGLSISGRMASLSRSVTLWIQEV